jgi:hypothetical protein
LLLPSIDAHLNHEETTMNNRGEQVVGELRRRITALVAGFDITTTSTRPPSNG